MTDILTQVHGYKLGLAATGELVSNEIQITQPAVGATITVSAEAATTANTRDIVVQLTDANGDNIAYAESVEIIMYLTADKLAYVVTGGSTGITIGAAGNGSVLPVVAKKYILATTEANGLLDLDWLDTGTEAAFLGIKLPNGTVVVSSALTNA